jgi:hypothetical protein
MKLETLYASTYTALAGRLGEDRNSIARALAEPNAPQKTRRGWSVQAVRDFLFVRRLAKMTDADFVALCQQVEHGSFDAAYFCDADNARSELEAIRRGGRQEYITGLRGEL